MVNQKCDGIPAFHDKMSLQSKLTWDLGILMKHENFGLKVTYINWDINRDDLFNDVGDHITY